MARTSYTMTMAHTDDATFRAWGLAMSNAFAAAGLVQTADTGQINWATALRPGGAAAAGYEIWRFSDALQATRPVFIKIIYGTGTGTTMGAFTVQVGTFANGAGALGGAMSPTTLGLASTTAAPNGVAYVNYCCFTSDGCFVFVQNSGAATAFNHVVVIERTKDTSGNPTGEGLHVFERVGIALTNSVSYSINFVTLVTHNEAGVVNAILSPWGVSADTANVNLANWFAFMPEPTPLLAACSHLGGEIISQTQYDAALLGSTPRHYLVVSVTMTNMSLNMLNAAGLSVLWDAA